MWSPGLKSSVSLNQTCVPDLFPLYYFTRLPTLCCIIARAAFTVDLYWGFFVLFLQGELLSSHLEFV